MTPPRTVTLFTHGYPGETAEAVGRLMALAGPAGVEVRASHDEAAKHSTGAAAAMALSDALETVLQAPVIDGREEADRAEVEGEHRRRPAGHGTEGLENRAVTPEDDDQIRVRGLSAARLRDPVLLGLGP